MTPVLASGRLEIILDSTLTVRASIKTLVAFALALKVHRPAQLTRAWWLG